MRSLVSPVMFEEEDTELMELAIEREDKYPFLRPSSASLDLMDRSERVISEWKNMDFDERIQVDPTYINRIFTN